MTARESWLQQQKQKVSERDGRLLDLASRTLEKNIAIADASGRPAPWHPLRGIRPSNDKYDGIWNWDAAFHAVAVARWDKDLAQEQADIFFRSQTASGGFIDVWFTNGQQVTDFGKPPVFAWACARIDEIAPDATFAKRAYDHLTRYEEHWRLKRKDPDEPLFHYGTESMEKGKRVYDPKLESGWDNSPRWDLAGSDLWPIDLNCYMVMLYRALQTLARRTGHDDQGERWRTRENDLVAAIEKLLWDDAAGGYCDARRVTGKSSGVLTPASFMPLYLNTAPVQRAERLARIAASEAKFFPAMPSVAYDHPEYRRREYWRGPTWLNIAYFALKGLRDGGYGELADEMRETILSRCWANGDCLYEYYDSRTGKGLGAPHFGWSAAFVIEFICNW